MREEVEEYRMPIQQYVTSILARDLPFASPPVLDVQLEHRIEYMAHQLVATLRLPADVLQDDKVIAEYPSSLWQHIKQVLGLSYERTQVRLTEHLVFPNVATPPSLRDEARMYVMPRITSYDPA